MASFPPGGIISISLSLDSLPPEETAAGESCRLEERGPVEPSAVAQRLFGRHEIERERERGERGKWTNVARTISYGLCCCM